MTTKRTKQPRKEETEAEADEVEDKDNDGDDDGDENKNKNDKKEKKDKDTKKIKLEPRVVAALERKGYRMDRLLGSGAFGSVFHGYYKLPRDPKKGSKDPESEESLKELEIAAKVMVISRLEPRYVQKFWPRELEALTKIRHPHIVAVYDIIRTAGMVFIFMEYASGGDLVRWLKDNGEIEPTIACYWFKHCLLAMEYMHTEHHYAHRDLKLDNVLLSNSQLAKITDFGFACRPWDPETERVKLSTTFCGTQPYYSAQIVARQPYSPFAADVWALGVMLFTMLENRYPFHWRDTGEMFREQTTPGFIRRRFRVCEPCDPDLVNLFESCFEVDEARRATMTSLLQSAWVLRGGKTIGQITRTTTTKRTTRTRRTL